jgi:signal transduction histidine kinase
MSGNFFLDWAALAVSLFNAILLLWLGLTVLLNAERRTWGAWLSAFALLAGFLFFLSHTILLSYGLDLPAGTLNFWWQMGWVPLVGIPLAWYAIMLWYSSHWQTPTVPASLGRRSIFWLCLVIAVFITGALLFASPLPSASQLTRYDLTANPAWHGFPVLILFYPLYALLCTVLSIEALLHPAPALRVMGEFARQRARPWLVSASVLLLVVSLLAAGVVGWLALFVYTQPFSPQLMPTLVGFDLFIAALIAATILVVGQAVVSYEVFTAKILPRQGLLRYWRRAVLLGAIFSGMMSWGTLLPLRPIYNLLLSSALVTLFFALLSWRSYVEGDRTIEILRPAAARQENELAPGMEMQLPFQVLCAQVLDARAALLVPLGQFAALASPPAAYPPDQPPHPPDLAELVTRIGKAQPLCLPLAPQRNSSLSWAVPLWNEGGLTGLLLLSDKRSGSLYTQEEMEIARSVCERLIGNRVSAELRRRLLLLQRQHLMDSQVADRRTRRSLHDEILPDLHALILALSSPAAADPQINEAVEGLSQIHGKIADLLHNLPPAVEPEFSRSGLVAALQQTLQREFPGSFDAVTWRIDETAEQKSLSLPGTAREVLFYAAREAIRNAARHAGSTEDTQPLKLNLQFAWEKGLKISIEDNGIGLPTRELEDGKDNLPSNSRGLALHSTLMAVIGGSLTLESDPGAFTRLTLFLPENVASVHFLYNQ